MVQSRPVKKKCIKTGVLYERDDEWYFLDEMQEERGPYKDKAVALSKLKEMINDPSRRA
jgi:hypothetical protein